MKHLLASAAILTLTFNGCRPQFDVHDLVGTYAAEYPFGREAISLQSDGTYRQEVVVSGSPKPAIHTGSWKYDQGSGRVTLDGCLVVSNGFGELNKDYLTPRSGLCVFPIERSYVWAGKIRFGSGAGHPHIRQN